MGIILSFFCCHLIDDNILQFIIAHSKEKSNTFLKKINRKLQK